MKDVPQVVEASKVDLVFQTADGPVHALSDIDLEINKGDFISLIGPSGCGKTTPVSYTHLPLPTICCV